MNFRGVIMVLIGRSPHGERGLKSILEGVHSSYELSLPSRGAWIEMTDKTQQQRQRKCRSPHGERGLKLCLRAGRSTTPWSLPSRGAWIEILISTGSFVHAGCRSPHGERGLK